MRAFPAPTLALGLLCGVLLSCPASGARAERPASEGHWAVARGLSADEIARIALELGSDEPARREAAALALTTLQAESLPGIAARLRQLKARRPTEDAARSALTAFRHAAGSRRADDEVDIAPGVGLALAESRTSERLAMAEPVLLLRALERMREPQAADRIADIFLLDEPGVWGHEARMLRLRGGLELLPHLIRLRSHDEGRIRSWAQSAVRALEMDDAKKATGLEDPSLAARVVTAYTDPLSFPAMPVLVRLVDSPSLQVRAAAREAVARFGKNAIWQLRELYQEVVGEAAPKAWDAERTAAELYRQIDAPRTARANKLLEQGMAAYVNGDLDAMKARYDVLLARFPDFGARAKVATGYAAFAEARMAADDLDAARDAYQRALRIDPKAAQAPAWRGQLAFITAERSLTRGVVDLAGYERALSHDPKLAAAQLAHDRLTGDLAARQRARKRMAAGAAIALLFGFLLLALRPRRTRSAQPSA